MKTNKMESITKNCSIDSKVSESIIDSGISESKNIIPCKSKYISEIEKRFDISIESQIIICGIDVSVMTFKDEFEKYLYFWSPTPKECFENSTSHVIDLQNCNSVSDLRLLECSGFENLVYKSDGSKFERIDLLISISKNGITKQFRIDNPKVSYMLEFGLSLDKNIKSHANEINKIKDYFNCALSTNPEDLEDWVINYLDSITK